MPLLVIAGLPEMTALPAAATINNNSRTRWRAIASVFTNRDRGIYGEPSAIPVGSRHCYEIETVNQVLAHAIAAAQADNSEAIRLRLEAHRANDVLLLPGCNFHLNCESRPIERFRAFMSGQIDVAGIEVGIRVEKFAFDRLAEFYKRMGGEGSATPSTVGTSSSPRATMAKMVVSMGLLRLRRSLRRYSSVRLRADIGLGRCWIRRNSKMMRYVKAVAHSTTSHSTASPRDRSK
ncbi:hypothetical protein NKI82_24030 [Mesorhizobium sp. M0482]|uniref:hypothetical protein n=1 Tax=Mesorhizobium sp. M0482 TaxID=2956948 RepID=UPI00333DD719